MRLTNLEARAARKRQSLKIGGRTRTDGTDGADWTHEDGLRPIQSRSLDGLVPSVERKNLLRNVNDSIEKGVFIECS